MYGVRIGFQKTTGHPANTFGILQIVPNFNGVLWDISVVLTDVTDARNPKVIFELEL